MEEVTFDRGLRDEWNSPGGQAWEGTAGVEGCCDKEAGLR